MGKRDYEGLNILAHGSNIRDKDYQRKMLMTYMFNRTQQMFRYNGLPESLPKRELEKLLQQQGYCTVFKLENGDLVADKGGFSGLPNGYYIPQDSIVTNPYFGVNKTFTNGKDCVIMRNDSFYLGLAPMFAKYAEMLATNEITMFNVDILTRIQALLMAGDSNGKKQADAYLKSIERGDLSFVNSNAFTENITTAPYATDADRSLTNLIEYEQYLKASWLNEIGVNSNYNMKRESLNSNESQLNGDFLLPLVDDMLECRQIGLDEINKLFGYNISVEKASSWEDIDNRESIESEADLENNDAQDIIEDVDPNKEEEVKDEAQ